MFSDVIPKRMLRDPLRSTAASKTRESHSHVTASTIMTTRRTEIVATSELTGRSKTRNGDVRPSAPVVSPRHDSHKRVYLPNEVIEVTRWYGLSGADRQDLSATVPPHRSAHPRIQQSHPPDKRFEVAG